MEEDTAAILHQSPNSLTHTLITNSPNFRDCTRLKLSCVIPYRVLGKINCTNFLRLNGSCDTAIHQSVQMSLQAHQTCLVVTKPYRMGYE